MKTKHKNQNPIHAAGRSGKTVRHSKEDALDDREFELLLQGARELSRSDYYYESDPVFVILMLGRLGLRRGELAHLHENWIDWRNEMIQIPTHHDCHKGESGDTCGYCRQLARQRTEVSEELTMEDAIKWMWVPKTDAASRDIYFGFDARVKLAIERYFENPNYKRFEASGSSINRRVKKSAELAPELSPSDIRPHSLRATAATYHAGRGLKLLPLMQMMGWAQPSTAEIYIGRNGTNTARALDSIHST